MPRYFFHVVNGEFLPDAEGMEIDALDRVKAEAIRVAGEMIRDQGFKLWQTGRYDMYVVDEQNRTQLKLSFEAEDLTGELSGEPDTAMKGTG
ncbi:DUF6894 family protein [Devosia aurantiaca]|uniref:DUF6894 domain-containing protein n=1 Tax=Devosia aurantiaca TaxID=2714858 RepID=A0A6M1SMW1_9HYPH|nr:hypothetical protein [Devosia aurantiaca]NGP18460.1 hypothetical protein [Devosia aurantiaca]